MQRLLYTSTQKRTKDLPGMTTVTLDVDGKLTDLGVVKQDSGSNEFKAFLANGASCGVYETKKQAGGTLKKRHDAGESTVAPVQQEATKPANVEPVVEAVKPETVPEIVEDEDEFGDDETNEPDAMDLDWLDPIDTDEEDLLAIPDFLKRTVGLAEEM